MLAGYFLLHLVIRVNLSDSLDLDEAQVVYLSQQLQLGYGSQPPLYAWLQWLMFSVFGLNLFSLSLLKNLLLLAMYLCVFFAARPLIGLYGAIAASASLILFPQIGWESQRDLTHSVVLTTLASATLWCYFAILRKPTTARHVLFGLLVGLGLQSKYNFAIVLAGLICASLLVPQHRQIVWTRKAGVSAVVAFLVLVPHGIWLVNNLEAAASGTLQKMAEGTRDAGYVGNVAAGLASLVVAVLAFTTPAVIAYGLVCRRYWKQVAINWHNPDARFFVFLYGSFLALLVLVLLTGEVGKIKDRWMQPLLFSLPLALFVMLPALPKEVVFLRIARITGVVALAVLLLMPLRVYLGPSLGKYVRAHHPYPQLTSELDRRFPQTRVVLAQGTLIAGNLHFQKPALRTLLLEDVLDRNQPLEGEFLVVMRGGAGSAWLERFRNAHSRVEVREQGRLTLQYRFGGKETISYDYAYVAITRL